MNITGFVIHFVTFQLLKSSMLKCLHTKETMCVIGYLRGIRRENTKWNLKNVQIMAALIIQAWCG